MAEIDGENRITMLELYNDITAQAWSMFDSEVESKDEFEASVTTSLQKSLTDLWNSYPFPFREKTHILLLRARKADYLAPTGNIKTRISNGSKVYAVNCNGNWLRYNPDCQYADAASGEPTDFYLKQNRIYFYPVPDKNYNVFIDYLSIYPACNEDGEEKQFLEEETDYLNIPEEYHALFKCALMPLTMWNYLIASESDENSSAYEIQYKRAYKQLIKYTKGIETEKTIGWRG